MNYYNDNVKSRFKDDSLLRYGEKPNVCYWGTCSQMMKILLPSSTECMKAQVSKKRTMNLIQIHLIIV